MDAAAILVAGMRRRGFTLAWCYTDAGHALEVTPPAGFDLTDALRAALARHREAVLDIVWGERFASDLACPWRG